MASIKKRSHQVYNNVSHEKKIVNTLVESSSQCAYIPTITIASQYLSDQETILIATHMETELVYIHFINSKTAIVCKVKKLGDDLKIRSLFLVRLQNYVPKTIEENVKNSQLLMLLRRQNKRTEPAVSINRHCKILAFSNSRLQRHHIFELSTLSVLASDDQRDVFKTEYLPSPE